MERIRLYSLEGSYTTKVLGSGKWVDGSNMRALEERLKSYLGVDYVVLTNNGTSSLLAAYWVLRKRWQALSTDPYTFPATYQPARLLGYDVRFEKRVLEEDARLSTDALNCIVHLFGQPSPLLGKTQGRPFIEDAAQAFGAELGGRKVGTFGTIGCYSFYPTKALHTCGHGGAVVTNDPDLHADLRVFIESGRVAGRMTDTIALNLRMDEIKAEFLLEELETYDRRIDIQRELARRLAKHVPGPQPFLHEDEASGARHVYSVFNLLVDNRDDFRGYMDGLGIDTMVYYDEGILPERERPLYSRITSSVVAIPCRWNLSDGEISRIERALKEWFA